MGRSKNIYKINSTSTQLYQSLLLFLVLGKRWKMIRNKTKNYLHVLIWFNDLSLQLEFINAFVPSVQSMIICRPIYFNSCSVYTFLFARLLSLSLVWYFVPKWSNTTFRIYIEFHLMVFTDIYWDNSSNNAKNQIIPDSISANVLINFNV